MVPHIIGTFRLFCPLLSWSSFYILQFFLSRVNDYRDPIAIFTTWVKIYSAKCFINARVHVGGLPQVKHDFLVQWKFLAVRYLYLRHINSSVGPIEQLLLCNLYMQIHGLFKLIFFGNNEKSVALSAIGCLQMDLSIVQESKLWYRVPLFAVFSC